MQSSLKPTYAMLLLETGVGLRGVARLSVQWDAHRNWQCELFQINNG